MSQALVISAASIAVVDLNSMPSLLSSNNESALKFERLNSFNLQRKRQKEKRKN
jgi:hypothetical protein